MVTILERGHIFFFYRPRVDLKPERESLDRADIFRQLKLEPEEHPVEPLVKGEWR